MLKCLFLLFLLLNLYQLGKSDIQVTEIEEDPEEYEAPPPDPDGYEDLRFPPSSITKESILKDHEKVDKSERKKNFEGPALAYITPWNNKGYDLAKWTSDKLTHIAPVWLQLKPQTADGSYSCRIEGTHDIDHGWMDEIRAKNEKIKIVPRVLFDGWQIREMQTMINHEQWSHRCLSDLLNFLTRNQFEGAVVELWLDVMSRSRGEAAESLIEFISSWGDAFHKRHLEIIIPVGPPINQNNDLTGMFLPHYLNALRPHVDYIQVMTYDYPSNKPAGVAPYNWVSGSIDALLEMSKTNADKLMIGLNHYGYRYTAKEMEAIKFDKYLEVLKKKNSQLQWDPASREHFVKSDGAVTYYPSLTSIELRLKLAAARGVGVAIWEYGQGLNYFTQLL